LVRGAAFFFVAFLATLRFFVVLLFGVFRFAPFLALVFFVAEVLAGLLVDFVLLAIVASVQITCILRFSNTSVRNFREAASTAPHTKAAL